MTLKFCSTIGLETTRLQWKTCCNHKGSELELFTTLHCITTCFLRQDHVGKKAIHRFFFCRNAAGVFRTQAHLSWTKITTLHYVCVMTPLAFLSPCKVFPAYKGSDGCPCFSSAAISGSNMGLWAYELNTGQLTCPTGPWVVQGGWLCAVTCTPACQHVPCRGLPSTMLTARQPDELSVQSNSHLSSHSTPPPGRSHCFTFLDLIALFSNWCMFFSVLLIWLMVAILSHRPLHWDISTKHCRAIGWLHNTGWQVTEVKPGGGYALSLCWVQLSHQASQHSNLSWQFSTASSVLALCVCYEASRKTSILIFATWRCGQSKCGEDGNSEQRKVFYFSQ